MRHRKIYLQVSCLARLAWFTLRACNPDIANSFVPGHPAFGRKRLVLLAAVS